MIERCHTHTSNNTIPRDQLHTAASFSCPNVGFLWLPSDHFPPKSFCHVCSEQSADSVMKTTSSSELPELKGPVEGAERGCEGPQERASPGWQQDNPTPWTTHTHTLAYFCLSWLYNPTHTHTRKQKHSLCVCECVCAADSWPPAKCCHWLYSIRCSCIYIQCEVPAPQHCQQRRDSKTQGRQ